MGIILYFIYPLLEQFFRPTVEEVMNIKRLFATGDMELAMEQSDATYPYLRELAGFIAGGGEFPDPSGKKII